MTVIDPSLELGAGASGGAPPEVRDLAMLRHDIRGALQGVIGGVGQIDAAGLDARAREQVERVAAAAQTLRALTCAMLGDDPAEDEARTVDVARFLRYVRRRHAGEARERGLSFEAEAEAGVPEGLRLDLVSLARIADNLVGNAINFSESGTVRLSVVRDPDGAIVFRVTDDGPGLAVPGAGGSDRSGEGLGLNIVRSLAAGLGGEMHLANRPAGGAVASVRFPAAAAAAFARGTDSAPDLTGLHVLLAEDNPTNQMVASQMLRSLNARVTVCNDGIEALECFDAEPTDLVVVDIEMPRLSGLDVIRAIRARSDGRAQVPIVALTAYAMREHRERIAAAGANGLISKPITSIDALGRELAVHVAPLLRAAKPATPAPEPEPDRGSGPAGPVIDLGTFDALCVAIGPDTMDELLDKVITDLLSAQRELAAALEPLERAPIRGASHILISVAGALGAVRLEACARRLNSAAHSDPAEQVVSGARRCIAEIDAAVAFARERRALR